MPSIDSGKELIPDEAAFWCDVHLALTHIYGQSPTDAGTRIEQRRVKLLDADPLERALVMHENPVFVAAALVAKTANSAEIKRFFEITRGDSRQ